LQDRFLLRFVVDYIAEDFRFLKLLQARPPAGRTTLTLAELEAARAEAAALSPAAAWWPPTAGGSRRSACCAGTPTSPGATRSPTTTWASSSTCSGATRPSGRRCRRPCASACAATRTR